MEKIYIIYIKLEQFIWNTLWYVMCGYFAHYNHHHLVFPLNLIPSLWYTMCIIHSTFHSFIQTIISFIYPSIDYKMIFLYVRREEMNAGTLLICLSFCGEVCVCVLFWQNQSSYVHPKLWFVIYGTDCDDIDCWWCCWKWYSSISVRSDMPFMLKCPVKQNK